MHEFTDGCASQYKSRHCFGDLSFGKVDFGYEIIRNYFETSHAKGVQYAAGGSIKNQADMQLLGERKLFKTHMVCMISVLNIYRLPNKRRQPVKDGFSAMYKT